MAPGEEDCRVEGQTRRNRKKGVSESSGMDIEYVIGTKAVSMARVVGTTEKSFGARPRACHTIRKAATVTCNLVRVEEKRRSSQRTM